MSLTAIDHDPLEPISKHFTYHECLYLPTWGRLATEADGLTTEVLLNLTKGAAVMDQVRDFFDRPINVHVWYRPPAYNKEVGGSQLSAHMCLNPGIWACDFDVIGLTCDEAKAMILASDLLERLDLRLEGNPDGSHWLHVDSKKAGSNRVFSPC